MTYHFVMCRYSCVARMLFAHVHNLLSFSFLLNNASMVDLSNSDGLFLNQMSLSVEHANVQQLTFLSECFK